MRRSTWVLKQGREAAAEKKAATTRAERATRAMESIAESLRDVCSVFSGVAKEVQRFAGPNRIIVTRHKQQRKGGRR